MLFKCPISIKKAQFIHLFLKILYESSLRGLIKRDQTRVKVRKQIAMEKENANFVQATIPKFDGLYDHWAMLMENLLHSKEFWNVVENRIPTLPEALEIATQEQLKAIEDGKLRDLKAKNYLFQEIDCNLLKTIMKKDTSKDIWESMKKKYNG